MAVRKALDEGDFSEADSAASSLVLQFSSLGSMRRPKVFESIVQSFSFCGGVLEELLKPGIVWPTTREVFDSTEGLDAGQRPVADAMPADLDNIDKLRKGMVKVGKVPFYRFCGATTHAKAAMPHIKTYARYDAASGHVAWCMVGSHNLSGAAWGVLPTPRERDDGQLYIRSFELSVLMLPSLELQYLKRGRTFDAPSGRWRAISPLPGGVERVQFRHLGAARAGYGGGSAEPNTHIVDLPLPYDFPSAAGKYRFDDTPWHNGAKKLNEGDFQPRIGTEPTILGRLG